MPKRSSSNNFKDVYDLNDLENKVVDKRIDKRKPEKEGEEIDTTISNL